jgi:4-amino-4-deoxy-L-arabinose transferase-like glycosyltransferase
MQSSVATHHSFDTGEKGSMKPAVSYFAERTLRYVLILGAVLFVVAYIALAAVRSRYPYELEWMEGGTVDHIVRILSGLELYVKPSIEFTPYIYPPVYYYISALVSTWTGVGFFAPRMVSILSSIGCLAIIFFFVRRETKSVYAGILSASLFAATYKISGAWLDIARVDSLFLLFILAAVYLIRFYETPPALVAAGVMLALSFLTKQIALIIAFPLLVYCFVVNRRRSIYAVGALAAGAGIVCLVLDRMYEGWFNYYIFFLPSGHRIVMKLAFLFWAKEIVMYLPVVLMLAIPFLYLQYTAPGRKGFLFYAALIVGMVGGAWISRMHSGSYYNALLPAYACLAIIFGLAVPSLLALAAAAPPRKQGALRAYLYVACLIQFVALIYNPRDFLPNAGDRAAGGELVAAIASIPGDVYVPCHTYLARLAGKSSWAHQMAIRDVRRSADNAVNAALDAEIRQAIRKGRFSAIVLDSESWQYQEEVNRYYEKERMFFENDGDVFMPVTGAELRPRVLYVPRDRSPQ